MDWDIQAVFAGKSLRSTARLLIVLSFGFLGTVGFAIPSIPHSYGMPDTTDSRSRQILDTDTTDTIVLPDPYDSDGLRLIAKQFTGSVNGQLGLGSANTAGCVSNNRTNMAMPWLMTNITTHGAWLGRYSTFDQLLACVEAVPEGTQNLIIGAHGCPNTTGPLNLRNFLPVARAIRSKGITHVALASCSVGRYAYKKDSLPAELSKESGADVTSYSIPVWSSSNNFYVKKGTIAYTWTNRESMRNADHIGVVEGTGARDLNSPRYPDRGHDWGEGPTRIAGRRWFPFRSVRNRSFGRYRRAAAAGLDSASAGFSGSGGLNNFSGSGQLGHSSWDRSSWAQLNRALSDWSVPESRPIALESLLSVHSRSKPSLAFDSQSLFDKSNKQLSEQTRRLLETMHQMGQMRATRLGLAQSRSGFSPLASRATLATPGRWAFRRPAASGRFQTRTTDGFMAGNGPRRSGRTPWLLRRSFPATTR